jgi:hypothetical protein
MAAQYLSRLLNPSRQAIGLMANPQGVRIRSFPPCVRRPLTAYSGPEAAARDDFQDVLRKPAGQEKDWPCAAASRQWLMGEFDWLMSSFSRPAD